MMFRNRFGWIQLLLIVVMVTIVFPVSAISQSNDQSDNPNEPTLFQLEKGNNRLTATTMEGDLEFVTLNVPTQHAITDIVLESYVSEFDYYMFIAIQTGTRFQLVDGSPTMDTLVGWSSFGPDYSDSNIASLGTEDVQVKLMGGIMEQLTEGDYMEPLAESDYTIMLRQDGDSTTYTLNFIVSDTTAVALSTPLATSAPSQIFPLILIFTLLAVSTSLLHKVSRSDGH